MTVTIGPRYVCIKCGTESAGTGLSLTVFDQYRAGHCRVCGKSDALYRLVPDPRAARAEGEAAVLAAVDEGIDAAWRWEAEKRLRELIDQGDQFTIDDITKRVGLPTHRNAVGALFSQFSRAGSIRVVGYTTGERSAQHARSIKVWQSK